LDNSFYLCFGTTWRCGLRWYHLLI
jgi:hypothetical protein